MLKSTAFLNVLDYGYIQQFLLIACHIQSGGSLDDGSGFRIDVIQRIKHEAGSVDASLDVLRK